MPEPGGRAPGAGIRRDPGNKLSMESMEPGVPGHGPGHRDPDQHGHGGDDGHDGERGDGHDGGHDDGRQGGGGQGGGGQDSGRHETELERADRNYGELLQELRVTQMGVQILFAFLLGLAFTARFPRTDTFERVTYVVTLLLAVTAAALLTAPAALHRMLFRRRAKKKIVDVSSRLAAYGLIVLALALTGSVLLVVGFVLGRPEGITAGSATLVLFTGLWAVLPWRIRRSSGPDGTGTRRRT